jgi:hypothetical protein
MEMQADFRRNCPSAYRILSICGQAVLCMWIKRPISGKWSTRARPIFSSIPYDLAKTEDESYFQAIFYIIFELPGKLIENVPATTQGSKRYAIIECPFEL